ncbi:MAG: hypothetical protein ABR976_02135 [Terracidiphilus sp.]
MRPADKVSPDSAAAESVARLQSIFVPDRLSSKNVWVAGLLAFFFGPPGMIYSTPIGALVMSIVSVPIWIFCGWLLTTAAWIVCIVWAVMAAQD